jgi:class 3 adenylate cyclase/integral membrane sensor domain MASE1
MSPVPLLLRRRHWRYWSRLGLTALGYHLLVKAIFYLPISNEVGFPLWLPAGLSLLVLYQGGTVLWPGIVLGSLLSGWLSGVLTPTAIVWAAVNNGLQPWAGVRLLHGWRFRPQLERLEDVGSLTATTVIISALSAGLGLSYFVGAGLLPWADLPDALFRWWIGNVTGILVLVPVVLTWRQWRKLLRSHRRKLWAILWLGLMVGLSWFIFCSRTRMGMVPYPLEYLPFPFLIWGTLQFNQPGAALATAVVTGLATFGVVRNSGPFFAQAANPLVAMQSLQIYICVFAFTALILAVIMAQREAARRTLGEEVERSERLLLNILPQPIAERLKHSSATIADSFAEVTVMFADIVEFTRISAHLPPEEIVALLNEIFSTFDQLAEHHGLEKIKTIGDAYMVVGGLPEPRPDHAQAVAAMALDLQQAIAQFCDRYHQPFQVRIGINTGPVVAGVIGTKKFIYDLWGDTVNIASRMESNGLANEIQVTEATFRALRHHYPLEPRGTIAVKGKGDMNTYLLKARLSPSPAIAKVDGSPPG